MDNLGVRVRGDIKFVGWRSAFSDNSVNGSATSDDDASPGRFKADD